MGSVVTLLNQKGGVGKTSSVFHMAGSLARDGLRVLLVDNDPQSSLTQGFFGPSAAEAIPSCETVAVLYEPDAAPAPESVMRPSGVPGVTLVPGSIALTRFNKLPDDLWPVSEGGLRTFLDAVNAEFDLIMIDCPPNLHLCSWAALVASSWIVVPLQPEDFGSQGLAPVQRSVREVQSRVNPSLCLAGYLLTMVDKRLAVHQTYEGMLRERYGPAVFTAVVPRAKDFVEAVGSRLPVSYYKPRSVAAKAIAAVASELLSRVVPAAAERGAA